MVSQKSQFKDVWLMCTNSQTLLVYGKKDLSSFEGVPIAVVKYNPSYLSARATRAVATKMATLVGATQTISILGENFEVEQCERDPERTNVWIEEGLFGEQYILVQVKGKKEPYILAQLHVICEEYVKRNAEELVRFLGYEGKIERRHREFNHEEMRAMTKEAHSSDYDLKKEFESMPSDWQNPEWNEQNKVHNWKNYVDDHVIGIWDTFSDYQKRALANLLQSQADNEDWD